MAEQPTKPYGEPLYIRPDEPIYFRGMETGAIGDAKQAALDKLMAAFKDGAAKEQEGETLDFGNLRKLSNKFIFEMTRQNYGDEKAQKIADEFPLNLISEAMSIGSLGTGQPNFTGGDSAPGSPRDLRKNVLPGGSRGL